MTAQRTAPIILSEHPLCPPPPQPDCESSSRKDDGSEAHKSLNQAHRSLSEADHDSEAGTTYHRTELAIHSRLPNTGKSIFTKINELAIKHDAINLAQGYASFSPRESPPPEGETSLHPPTAYLISRLTGHCSDGRNHYAPATGVTELRKEIANLILDVYGRRVNPESEVTVTAGATEGLYVAIQSLVREGDEVLLFNPGYESYHPMITMAGGTPVYVPMDCHTGRSDDSVRDATSDDIDDESGFKFKFNWAKIRSAVTDRTRVIVINTPHNPTSLTFQVDDWTHLDEILAKHPRIYVISDEVYEFMTFYPHHHHNSRHDGHNQHHHHHHPHHHQHHGHHRERTDPHPVLYSANSFTRIANRSLIISSLGKTFSLTGWDIGYVVGVDQLTTEIRKLHQYVTFAANTPMQHTFADALTSCRSYVLNYGRLLCQHKHHTFRKAIAGSRFRLLDCHSSFFQLLDYGAVSEDDDEQFCRYLLETHKVAAVPLSAFYHNSSRLTDDAVSGAGVDAHSQRSGSSGSQKHTGETTRSASKLRIIRICFGRPDEDLKHVGSVLSRL